MKTYPGLGPETLVPRVVGAALAQLKVGAEEGFVLSRVDGNTTVGEICLLVPFVADVTIEILKALRRMGAIDVPGAEPTAVAPPATEKLTPLPRAPATAAAPVANTTATAAAAPAANTTAAAATPASGAARAPATPESSTAPPGPPPARLVGIDLTVEQAERIDSYFGSLEGKDAFELLEVTRAADKRAIKRAYFKLSKEFHPDRFFGQTIGPYKERLSRIFQSVKAAFELLSDDTRRAAYEQSSDQK